MGTRPELQPAVGDWVLTVPHGEGSVVDHVFERRSALVRQAAGRRIAAQVVAANIDTVFIVTALDSDLNPRRIERYIAMVWSSGASPVILINKADIAEDPSGVAAVEEVALAVPVHLVSGETGRGMDLVRERLAPGRTFGFVGSSGVGKSTLINALAGQERQRVQAIRKRDGRGQHTTTRRELIVLPHGVLIDTPGMRQLQVWSGDALDETFADIVELAERCRFRDCAHGTEPGCAVQAAISAGELSAGRLKSHQKLQREAARLEAAKLGTTLSSKRRWKAMTKANRVRNKILGK